MKGHVGKFFRRCVGWRIVGVGLKMLELNLQAISVQRAIDGALEKLLYVQTRENFKFLAQKPCPKFFKNSCDILPIIEYQNIFNRLFYLFVSVGFGQKIQHKIFEQNFDQK